jgi:hypothetical protein
VTDKGRRLVLLFASVLLLSNLACGIGRRVEVSSPPAGNTPIPVEATATAVPTAMPTSTAQSQPPTPTAVSASPTQTPVPTAKPAEPDPLPTEVPSGQSPLDAAQIPELKVTTLDPRGTPLTQLGTFRQRMTAEFHAADGTYNGVYHYGSEVNTGAQAVHVTVSVEGKAAEQFPANHVEAIWIGTRLWIKLGNRPWVPVPEEVSEAQFDEQTVSVGAFLPYVSTFERIQPDETVNGVQCVHYAYDAQDLPTEYGPVDARGHIWVALDGGYVVRYTLEAVGAFGAYFEGTGTLNLVYDTYDVGASIQIDPPRC